MRKIFERSIAGRERLFHDESTNAFRIFNSRADGLEGLIIDKYGDYLLAQYYTERAAGLLNESSDFLPSLMKALRGFPVQVRGVLTKNRKKMQGPGIQEFRRSIVLDGEAPPPGFTVVQNGVRAYADLMEGQNTGIFLDMRDVRNALVPVYRREKTESCLNLFAYTSVFSIHAILNGVSHAVNVDLSKSVLKRARENYRLNGLPVDERDFLHGDAAKWLKKTVKGGRCFGFAFFDPPTFSRNKAKTFSIKKNYVETLMALQKAVPGGIALTTVNSYSVSRDEYLSFHPRGWELEEFFNESWDCLEPGAPYLKAGLWRCPA